jgi:hypothetical protein
VALRRVQPGAQRVVDLSGHVRGAGPARDRIVARATAPTAGATSRSVV